MENITQVYQLPCVVAINRFPTDTEAELALVERKCRELGVNVALSEVWAKGGEGGQALADEVVRLCEEGDAEGRSAQTFQFAYGDDLSLAQKIEAIATRVYRADGVDFEPKAAAELKKLEDLGFGGMPVCMAKTQYSFSDDAEEAGRAARLPHHGAQREGVGRRRLRGGAHRRHHDHARPAEGPRRRTHRRGRDGQDLRAVLGTFRRSGERRNGSTLRRRRASLPAPSSLALACQKHARP